jgi:hypothetical protein
MEIKKITHLDHICYQKKMDKDEKIVRKTLAKVWIQFLEKNGRPGAIIPSEEEVRDELIRVGVNKSVAALKDAHWFAFDWMIREKVQTIIENELARFDLVSFMEDVKEAQEHPERLNNCREIIREYLLRGL